MIKATYLDQRRADKNTARGHWTSSLVDSALDHRGRSEPDRIAVVDRERVVTYGELNALVNSAAAGLGALGVGKGDAVAWQLPNWLEAIVVHHAAIRLGAVSNPIIPIYRHREVGFILRQTRAPVVVVPTVFRSFDFPTMIDDLRPELPDLQHVLVVGDDPDSGATGTFAGLIGDGAAAVDGDAGGRSSDDVTLVLYTSGTTSDPKGVLHTHSTLEYENRSIIELYGLGGDDVVFMPSPLAHITGVLYGMQLPFMLGASVVLQDVWSAERALELIERWSCTFTIGATPFLHGLVYSKDLSTRDVTSLRVFGCGGADVPPTLIADAERCLGCTANRIYGSTEFPTLTASNAADPASMRATTDGRVLGSAQARVVGDDGETLGEGSVGELLVRGPELFVGYLDAALNQPAFEPDGWFRTGDLAVMQDGAVRITGRSKDIIIRGGENISAKEVEDLLFDHPDVADIAVVAMPDPVMGERICAYVAPTARGGSPTLKELVGFLLDKRLAKQKLPEHLVLVDELPRTASGKIQKFKLREDIRGRLEQSLH
jgi:cyclohexanecarboxylate-CoA ligase